MSNMNETTASNSFLKVVLNLANGSSVEQEVEATAAVVDPNEQSSSGPVRKVKNIEICPVFTTGVNM